MKRTALLFLFVFFVFALALVPSALAQENHGEVGVFANYFRHQNTGNTNFVGLGGRLSLNVQRRVQLEAEMAYDFQKSFTEGFQNTGNGAVSLQRSPLRVLHGLFGPKLQTGGGALRAFVTVKGGFIDFRFDDRPATFQTFTSTVGSLRVGNVNAVLYPGGGLEAYAGPVGLRLDIGDEMYFRGGAQHNLRIAFGPHIRF
jgi:hypothetical protein